MGHSPASGGALHGTSWTPIDVGLGDVVHSTSRSVIQFAAVRRPSNITPARFVKCCGLNSRVPTRIWRRAARCCSASEAQADRIRHLLDLARRAGVSAASLVTADTLRFGPCAAILTAASSPNRLRTSPGAWPWTMRWRGRWKVSLVNQNIERHQDPHGLGDALPARALRPW